MHARYYFRVGWGPTGVGALWRGMGARGWLPSGPGGIFSYVRM
jgi:hypothetical protein